MLLQNSYGKQKAHRLDVAAAKPALAVWSPLADLKWICKVRGLTQPSCCHPRRGIAQMQDEEAAFRVDEVAVAILIFEDELSTMRYSVRFPSFDL